MGEGWPKPEPKVREPRKLTRKAAMRARTTRLKYGNAYTQPEWRAQVRRIRKRSGGICEAKVRCNGDPVQGDPHHTRYLPMKGKGRVLVDDADLLDCCRRCHLWYEHQKETG